MLPGEQIMRPGCNAHVRMLWPGVAVNAGIERRQRLGVVRRRAAQDQTITQVTQDRVCLAPLVLHGAFPDYGDQSRQWIQTASRALTTTRRAHSLCEYPNGALCPASHMIRSPYSPGLVAPVCPGYTGVATYYPLHRRHVWHCKTRSRLA
jgi:hypothetical protein